MARSSSSTDTSTATTQGMATALNRPQPCASHTSATPTAAVGKRMRTRMISRRATPKLPGQREAPERRAGGCGSPSSHEAMATNTPERQQAGSTTRWQAMPWTIDGHLAAPSPLLCQHHAANALRRRAPNTILSGLKRSPPARETGAGKSITPLAGLVPGVAVEALKFRQSRLLILSFSLFHRFIWCRLRRARQFFLIFRSSKRCFSESSARCPATVILTLLFALKGLAVCHGSDALSNRQRTQVNEIRDSFPQF